MRFRSDALLQSLVEFTQRFLGFELVRDISVGTEPTHDFAGFIADRLSTREEPAERAVTTSQWERVLPRLVILEAFLDVPENAFEMIGMVQFLPAKALHLFERGPGIIVPPFVVPISPAFGIRRPGKLADVVGEFAESRFAFSQRMLAGREHSFGALAIGYVFRDDVNSDNFSLRRLQGMPVRYPNMVSVAFVGFLPANLDTGNRLTGPHDGFDDLFDLVRNCGNGVANRSANVVRYRNTADFRQSLIDLHIPTVEREKREPHRGSVIDQLKLGQPLVELPILLSQPGKLARPAGKRGILRTEMVCLCRLLHHR